MVNIKNVLISQPPPERGDDHYLELAKKYNFKILFRKLFKIEGVPSIILRQEKVKMADFTAVIFTSKNAVDHFLRMSKEMRFNIPESMKYFCISESVSRYLTQFIQYRKSRVIPGKQHFSDLIEVMHKHKNDNFLLPTSNILKPEIPRLLDANKFNYTKIVFYNTIPNDLKDVEIKLYDMIVFFSPAGIKSLFHNYPKYKQGKTIIAAFGSTTANAAKEAGLTVNIKAPTPKAHSMTTAIEQFLEKNSKNK